MNKSFHEIFTEVHDTAGKANKAEVLKKYSSPQLKTVLGYTYDPNVTWLLPEGDPPYTPASAIDGENVFKAEMRRLYLFVKGPTDAQKNLKPMRREKLFIEMLESIHPDDAKVLLAMKNRRLPYKGLTRSLVELAFPSLTQNWNVNVEEN
jgi:hypothetical protein